MKLALNMSMAGVHVVAGTFMSRRKLSSSFWGDTTTLSCFQSLLKNKQFVLPCSHVRVCSLFRPVSSVSTHCSHLWVLCTWMVSSVSAYCSHLRVLCTWIVPGPMFVGCKTWPFHSFVPLLQSQGTWWCSMNCDVSMSSSLP